MTIAYPAIITGLAEPETAVVLDGVWCEGLIRQGDIGPQVLCIWNASGGRCCDIGTYGGESCQPVLTLNLRYIAERARRGGNFSPELTLTVDKIRANEYAYAGEFDYSVSNMRPPGDLEGVVWHSSDDDPCEPHWEYRALVWRDYHDLEAHWHEDLDRVLRDGRTNID